MRTVSDFWGNIKLTSAGIIGVSEEEKKMRKNLRKYLKRLE